MIKSRFRTFPYLMGVFDLLIVISLSIVFGVLVSDKEFVLDNEIYIGLGCVLLGFGSFSYKEMTTRAIKLTFENNDVTMNLLLGFGKSKRFQLSEFDGFNTTVSSSFRDRTYESLFLIKNGKKIIVVSEYYQKNYNEVKKYIELKTKCLGSQSNSLIQEIKDIF